MINLKEKVTSTIEAFRTSEQEHINLLLEAIKPYQSPTLQRRYSQAGLNEAILSDMAEIKAEWKRSDEVLNQLIGTQIQDAKKEVFGPEPEKSADYSLRISNALRFLELQGTDIDDVIAFSILKDFIDDPQQMQLFERVVQKQTRLTPLEMHHEFPKTFGKSHEKQFLIHTFNEIESLAENLFLHPKAESNQGMFIGRVYYSVPISGYIERTDESSVIKLAEVIDGTLQPEGV